METRVVSRVAAKVQSGKRRLPSLQRAVRGPRARLGYGALGGRGVARLYRVLCIMVQAGGESHRRALTQYRALPIRRATPRSSRGRSARRHSTRRAPVRSGRAHVFLRDGRQSRPSRDTTSAAAGGMGDNEKKLSDAHSTLPHKL